MKKIVLFVVVVLHAACSTPRQVVSTVTVEKVVTLHDTILVETPIPFTSVKLDTFIVWSGGDFLDTITVEDSTSSATVIASGNRAEGKRRYQLTSSRKADTVFQQIPVVLTDTIFVNCPCPPAMPSTEPGKFPWSWVLGALGALLVFFVGKRRKKE